MTVTYYRLSMPKDFGEEFDNPHFELRIDDSNRPLHIAIRNSSRSLIINSMQSDIWQEEVEEVCELPIKVVYLEVSANCAKITVNGREIHFEMKASDNSTPLTAASVGVEWEIYHDASNSDQITTLKDGSRQFKIFGKTYVLPGDMHIWDVNRSIIHPSYDRKNDYRAFIGAHNFSSPGGKLTIIDTFKADIYPIILADSLMDNVNIIPIEHPKSARKSILAPFANINNLKKLKETKSKPDLCDLLKNGHVLLQGDNVFEIFGPEISELSEDQRSRLSFFTREEEIIPGNIVLPCRNAFVTCGEKWKLRHNHSYSRQNKRLGLDIVIASYNGGDYVIDCAKSLLCNGRNDVRVILVDDGSTDDSARVAEKIFSNDARVRIVRKLNGGCASARNYGRLISDATHIAFVDADDLVTPNFFADLYDLSLYTGAEITSGGFDFLDASLEDPHYPSYEDGMENEYEITPFKGLKSILVPSSRVIKGQPTIWRKVYRRDFLDAKNIYFPENIRAYDDYIFHIITSTETYDFYMLPEHLYHYRQHAGQDIKQGDERHFYMLQMFHTILRQSIEKSWSNFSPYIESIIDSINWSSSKLKPELVDSFLLAGAKLIVVIRKTYGVNSISDDIVKRVLHPDFKYHVNNEWKKVAALSSGAHWVNAPISYEHPDLVRMRANLPAAK